MWMQRGTRREARRRSARRILCAVVTVLTVATSSGLTTDVAGAARKPPPPPPTDDGSGGDTGDSKGVANPKLIAVQSLSRHRVLVTYDRDLDPPALQASSYAFYSTQAVNLPVTGASRASTNQVFVTTGPQEPVTYTVQAPKTSRPIKFTGSDLEEPKVVAATPLSQTQILVTFSMPMGPSAFDATQYIITEAGTGAPLVVLGAAQYDSTMTRVLLTTDPQNPVPYIIELGNILSTSGAYMDPGSITINITGSTVLPGPMLLGGSSDGETRVVLTFDAPLDPASAADISSYSVSPALTILSATLQADGRQVVLVTSPQYQVDYRLTVQVLGADGNPVNPTFNSLVFRGNRPIDLARPRVVTAASTGNKTVIVQFSKPMAESTADPSRFTIVQTVTHPEVGALIVTAAEFVGSDHMSVELTTLSQAEVTYQVTVNNVTDVLGLPLADRVIVGGVVTSDPTSFAFPGTPPAVLTCPRVGVPDAECEEVDERVNSDGDTLWDHEETRGWVIEVVQANGLVVQRQITSNPFSADTDGDGLLDDMERSLNIDPRDDDTDDDALTDWAEFNEIYSDPTFQDTDADSIYDGYEVTSFRTSPIQADTDGDQRNDAEEINVNRNPRVSDLPKSAVDVGSIDLLLDVRFDDTTSAGQTTSHSETSSATLTQSQSKEYSTTDARTIEAASRLSHTAGVSIEIPTSPGAALFGGTAATVSYEATNEESSGLSFASSFTDTSAQETTQEYEESLTSETTLSSDETRSRHVEGASIKVSAMLRSVGDIAFTMSDVQLTALVQDPNDPSQLTPVATLTPQAAPADGYSLGPLSPERGPIVFASQPDQVFPLQIEELMRNPKSVIVRFSNYDITDEQGRNFAFASQDVYDRTGGLVIDYGSFDANDDGRGDATENLRVATGLGRWVADTDGDDIISPEEGRAPRAADDDPDARWAAFDVNGAALGLTLRELLQTAGLTEYDEAEDPSSSLTAAQKSASYSVIDVPGFGERLFRVRQAERGPGKEWQIWTPTGLDRSLGLDDIFVVPGSTFRLTFVEDVDDDGLPGVLEWINGCKDDDPDTDGDSLDDHFETISGWPVSLGLWGQASTPTQAYSSCHLTDSDDDGLPDVEEAPGVLTRDARGVITTGDALGLGTVATTGSSVVGTGTSFLTTFEVGDTITVAGQTGRVISAIADDTHLTVSTAFSTAGSGLGYQFVADAPARRALGTTTTVASAAAMTALPAQRGDFAIRTDLDSDGIGPIQPSLLMLTTDDPTVAASWVKAPTNDPGASTDPVKRAMADPISNPSRRDTDGDGITDGAELTPHEVVLRFANPSDPACTAPATGQCTPPLITAPEWKDSDGDSATDGLEQLVGGDPTQSDRNSFADDDGDGLVNIQETTGWVVEIETVSGNAGFSDNQPCDSVCPPGSDSSSNGPVSSNPNVKDTDGDGLTDREEMELVTNPNIDDTDDDGLTDQAEVQGFNLPTFGAVATRPLDADTDDDRRTDGEEVNRTPQFIVRLEGNTPYEVFTSPTNADRDFDRLVDGEEYLAGTDPGKADTDGDPRSDYVEVQKGRNPLLPDMLVTMNFAKLFVANDGESDGGDFEFVLQGFGPNGPATTAVHSFPTTFDGVAPLNIPNSGTEACSSTTICRKLGDPTDPTDFDVIEIESGRTLFFNDGGTLGKTVNIGSVSMTDKVPQQFGVSGHLYEREHDGNKVIDCWFDFPDPFANIADGSGVVRGSEMKLGTSSMAIHRSGSCNIQSDFEFTIFVSYTAS